MHDMNGGNYYNSPEAEKKKLLSNNYEEQIKLHTDQRRMDEEMKKKEDERYMQDMQSYYPFGKGGAGAPRRDKFGNIITNRKALVSDPKYQHYTINVDDDYNDVWKKEKQYGLINFVNKNNQAMNDLAYQPYQRSQSSHNLYNPSYNNFNPDATAYFANDLMNNPQYDPNQPYYQNDRNFSLPVPIQQPNGMEQQTQATNENNQHGLNISYRNYDVDSDAKRQERLNYGNQLKQQMEEQASKKTINLKGRKR